MAQWGRSDEAVANGEISRGAPIGVGANAKWDVNRVDSANAHTSNTSIAGSRANTDFNMFANDTPNAFLNNMAIGVFGVSPKAMANNIAQASADRPAHAGWNLRRAYTGGIATAVPTAVAGSGFANGETIVLSNGTSNALLTVTTNSSGNMVSLTIGASGGTIVGGSGWANTTMVANAFVRQLHLANVTSTGGNSYNNSDIITVSNVAGVLNAAVVQISTNSVGGIVNAALLGANTLSVGLFAATQTNAGLIFTITNSTGGTATGNTTTTSLAAKIIPSTGGGFTITLGGRAGRVHTETLVAMGSLGVSNSTLYGPNSATFSNSATINNSHYPDA